MSSIELLVDVCRLPDVGWLPALPLRLSVAADATVNELGRAAEAALCEAGAGGARVSLVLNPMRDGVLPPQALVRDVFDGTGATALVVADVPGAARAAPPQTPRSLPAAAAPSIMGGGPKRADGKIPITVLTGFLGSGKTTLLNHLLHTQRDQKIAVIENEFGEVPIDNELLSASKLAAAEQVIVMDNGCMCCSVRGDILGAFASIFAAVEAGKPLDAVLIETTGMADPVPIVRTLLQTPAIASQFALTGVVTLCDAKNILQRLREISEEEEEGAPPDEAFQQLMFADMIVLNKIDLVSTAQALEVWQRLRAINARAAVLPCVRGAVDASALVAASGFDLAQMAEEEVIGHGHEHGHGAAVCDDSSHDHGGGGGGAGHEHGHDAAVCDEPSHDHGIGHEHGHEAPDHGHAHGGGALHPGAAHGHGHDALPRVLMHNKHVGSFSLLRPGRAVEPLRFARWMRRVASAKQHVVGTLYRSKAVLAVAGSSRKLAFHAVQDVMEKSFVGSWDETEEKGCKIVFIGKKLNRQYFESSFDDCLVPLRSPLRASHPTAPTPTGTGAPSPAAATPASIAHSRSHCPVSGGLSDLVLDPPSANDSLLLWMVGLAPEMLYALTTHLPSIAVARLACTCTLLADALLSDTGAEGMQGAAVVACAAAGGASTALAFQPKDDPFLSGMRLHGLLPLPAIGAYVSAFRSTGVEVVPFPGLTFSSHAELEAAAVTLLELAEAGGSGTADVTDTPAEVGTAPAGGVGMPAGGGGTAFVVEFSWRAETLAEFFKAGPEASTRSALTKVEVYNENQDEWDSLKFRLCLEPAHLSTATTELAGEAAIAAYAAAPVPAGGGAAAGGAAGGGATGAPEAGGVGAAAPAAPELTQHRMVFQLVGGKTASQVYMLSFHTIDPTYQVHVKVADHRMPTFASRETFHRWHPLMAQLAKRPAVRMLVRVKSDGSGPLTDMCGCC